MTMSKVDDGGEAAMNGAPHIPVLLQPMLTHLAPKAGETYIDGTFGAGGYSSAILQQVDCRVIGLDQDPDALKSARPLLHQFGSRLSLLEGRYSDMERLIGVLGIEAVDGVVLDIGVSSMQLDQAARGFSFRFNGPLDMRMSQSGPTAADLVNGLSEEELAAVLWRFGEEKKSRKIAREIVLRRALTPFTETSDLADLIATIMPKRPGDKIHPATRTFQALRIYLNDELGELLRGLNAGTRLLAPGGRLVVVSFHSLEDRIVKRFLRLSGGRVANQSRHLPDVNKETAVSYQIINSKAVKANGEEIEVNPRARSALLRAAVRTSSPALCFDEGDLGLSSFQL